MRLPQGILAIRPGAGAVKRPSGAARQGWRGGGQCGTGRLPGYVTRECLLMPPGFEPICGPSSATIDGAGQPVLRLPASWNSLPIGLFSIPEAQFASCLPCCCLQLTTKAAAGTAKTADRLNCARRTARSSCMTGSFSVKAHAGTACRCPGGFSAISRKRVIDFIQVHLGDELSITLLAQKAGLNSRHFPLTCGGRSATICCCTD